MPHPAFRSLLRTLAARLGRPARRPQTPSRPGNRRPGVELLEDRTVPANVGFVTTADGLVTDADLDGTFEAAYGGGDTVPVRWQASTGASPGIARGVFEFDLSRLAPGTTIRAATVGLDVTAFTAGTAAPQVNFVVYVGDGSVTTGDGAAPGAVVGSASVTATGYQEFSLNPGVFTQLLRTPTARKVTVRAELPQASVASVTFAGTEFGGRRPATLTLDVPAPGPYQMFADPAVVSETAGPNATTVTFARFGDLSLPITFTLTSSDTTEATVPPSVTFAAGEYQLTFPVTAVDDAIADDIQQVFLTAQAVAAGEGSPVGLDTTFGAGGTAATDLRLEIQPPRATLARQPDGKLVVAGEDGTGAAAVRVQRFNADGTPDSTFGTGGTVTTPLPDGGFPVPSDVVVQPDGKILVGGKYAQGTGTAFLARYNANGTLDTTFGAGSPSGGLRTGIADLTAINGWVEDVAVDLANGPTFGRITLAVAANGTVFFQAARLLPDGTYDTSFGSPATPGRIVYSNVAGGPSYGGNARAVSVYPGGSFLLAGGNKVARFLANGSPDTSFGSGGVRLLDFGTPAAFTDIFAIETDQVGRIVLGASVATGSASGSTNNFTDFAAARLDSAGSLDATFGGDGTVTTGFSTGLDDVPSALVLQPDGRVVLAGYAELSDSPLNRQAALVRFLPDGTLDAVTFDGDGRFQQSLVPSDTEVVFDAVLQPDGKLVALAGWGTDYRLARFNMGPALAFPSTTASVVVRDDETPNRPPAAQSFSVTIPEDTVRGINLPFVQDPELDPITYEILTQPAAGTGRVTLSGNDPTVARFVYFPAPDFVGTTTFTYRANDPQLTGPTATITVNVVAVAGAPDGPDAAFTVAAGGTLQDRVTATDPNGDPLTYSVVTGNGPAHADVFAVFSDGRIFYRPATGYVGTDSFIYTVTDGTGSDVGMVTITVLGANRPPVIDDQTVTAAEDTPFAGTLLASDPDGQTLTFSRASLPANGTTTVNADGSFSYTPNSNFNGTDSFTVRVSDGTLTDTAVVTVTVTPVNDAPVVTAPAAVTTDEDVILSLGGVNITDVDAGSANVVVTLAAGHGGLLVATTGVSGGVTAAQVQNNGTGSVTVTAPLAAINATLAASTGLRYRPTPNYNGPDAVTVSANDQGNTGAGGPQPSTKTLAVTVNAVNDAPVAFPTTQSATTNEDTPVSGTVTGRDVENDPLTFSGDVPPEGLPAHGSVTVNADGSYTYTPATDFNGTDQFVFKVSDPAGAFGYGLVTVRVLPVNDAPVARDDAYTVDEDQTLTITVGPVTRLRMVSEPGDFVGQGSPGTNQPLVLDYAPPGSGFTARTNFDNGVEVRVSDPTVVGGWTLDFAAPGNALLTPGTYLDAQRFPFQAADRPGLDVSGDGRGLNQLTGRFTVYDVAYGPAGAVTRFAATFVQQDLNFNGTVDPPLSGAVLFNTTFGAGGGVLANDTDADGDVLLTAALVSGPSSGTLALNPDGTFSYTPNPNFFGTDSFTYRTGDGTAPGGVATVTITVRPVNDPPVQAVNAGLTVAEGASAPLTPAALTATDVDNSAAQLTYTVTTAPAHGSLRLGGIALAAGGVFTQADVNAGRVSYAHDGSETTADGFTFSLSDGAAPPQAAAFAVTVTPVNDAPVAQALAVSTDEDVPAAGTLPVTDADGGSLAYAVVAPPAHGTVTLNTATGEFTYAPNADYFGADSFTFRASDGSLESNVATVSITVTPVNDDPTATADSLVVDEDAGATVVPVLTNDSPAPDVGESLTVVSVGPAANGVASLSGGVVRYSPNANYNGPDSFSYTITDGHGGTATATVSVVVRPVNDAPTATSDVLTVAEDAAATVVPVLDNDTFAPDTGETLSVAAVTQPAFGTTTLVGGVVRYAPRANYSGSDSFTYTLSDGNGGTTSGWVTVIVTPVNDAPTANTDALTVAEDAAPTAVPVLANDTFAPDTGETLTVVAVTQPAHGTVTLLAGVVSYVPAADFNGTDTFTYTISDGNGGTAVGTVRVTVTAVNDRPTVAAPATATTAEDTVLDLTALGGVAVADTADGNAGTFTASVTATNGTLTGTGFTGNNSASLTVTGSQAVVNAALATLRFRPAANFTGSATLTTTVNDNGNTGAGGPFTATAATTIAVTPVNDAPTVTGGPFTVRERAAAGTEVGTVTGQDVEGAALAYSIVGGNTNSAFAVDPATGRITVANPAALVIATTAQFQLTVRASEPGGLSGEATVVVTVVAATQRVTIDVIPDGRHINSRSNGKIEVAIMGAAGLDVRSIDVASLRFGRTGQEDSISRDGRGRAQVEYRDVDDDGRLDLVVRFDTARTGFRPGDARAYLTGKLLNGDAIAGDDAVSVV
ncbi:Ig-like domain-containing protein [Urbifossiella limnaea]|uniref:Cadherin domain protein n=1 Tax=Urbifossiella limnaea TaxID=2528023 RepID=A0A517XWR8_9BACT|nr:Ig-like domain-containing protein [Urbifossiella limnaea]QDU21945.1 Cadherin domain protein [Urbifossiella limnaea]